MKFLSVVIVFFTFSAIAQTRKIALKANETLSIVCTQGNIVEVKDNVVKCGCPVGLYSHVEGDVMTCETLCFIKTEMIEEKFENCDQGGCYPYGIEKYRTLTLRKGTGEILYQERIWSPRKRELEMLLSEAKAVAEKGCFKTIISIHE
jgi:hypothetical protein